ncbi:MAG TPA: shikimate kinase [Gemmatimonadales bacterium]|nr:shikimate kinase [Gemmatimonadales bacterium]
MKRHVVLIGLPGSGKTTVGRLVAEQLHAGFVDIDGVILRREGKPIAMIFAEKGEAAFRALEQKEMATALGSETPALIASGGGWAAQPGAVPEAKARALIVYLRTRPETCSQRAEPQGTRPLLMGEDPVALMRQLSKERGPAYQQADETVDTDRKTAVQVAAEVVRLAQKAAGW